MSVDKLRSVTHRYAMSKGRSNTVRYHLTLPREVAAYYESIAKPLMIRPGTLMRNVVIEKMRQHVITPPATKPKKSNL